MISLCGPLCFSVALCVTKKIKNLHSVAQRTTESHREKSKIKHLLAVWNDPGPFSLHA